METMDLELGAFLPRWDDQATPDGWRRVAQAAEHAGFSWVGRGDRIVFPADQERSAAARRPASELFSVLTAAACETSDIRIGTNVCVAPYRHPIHLIKQIFTLDQISDGRFEFGVGAGWFEGEFAALGVPYEERGHRTNEFLEIFDQARVAETIAYEGTAYAFEPVGMYPRPKQQGGPPLWIGGSSSAAFRRTAMYGIGWTISGRSPNELAAGRDRLIRAWEDYDRDGRPRIAANVNAYLTDDPVEDGGPMVGSVDRVLDGIGDYREAGADRINLTLSTKPNGDKMTIDERVRQIERFADEIMSAL